MSTVLAVAVLLYIGGGAATAILFLQAFTKAKRHVAQGTASRKDREVYESFAPYYLGFATSMAFLVWPYLAWKAISSPHSKEEGETGE